MLKAGYISLIAPQSLHSHQAQIEDLSQKYQNKSQYFRVNVEVLGKVPAWTKDRLAGSTQQIFTILSDQLNIQDLRQVELNVKVFDNRWAYQRFADEAVGGVGKWSGGFYNSGINTAAVLHQGHDEVTHQVARHESTHVIMSGLFGQIPTWFTEGMAEYFEHLKVSGQGKTIHPDQQQMALLQSRSLPHLSQWLSQGRVGIEMVSEISTMPWLGRWYIFLCRKNGDASCSAGI